MNSLKAEDNTIYEDLNGDGVEECLTYDFKITQINDDDSEYRFVITEDGDKIYVEDEIIKKYTDDVETSHSLHDDLFGLGWVKVQVVDANPKDKYKEIVVSYYHNEDNVLLAVKVLRYKKKNKLTVVSESANIMPYSYVPKAQKNNKYLTISTSVWTTSLGCIWLKLDYKLTKNGLIPQLSKTGVYTVAPEFAEDYKQSKFKAARTITVFGDKTCTEPIGEIAKGKKFTLKKVLITSLDDDAPFIAYVKASSGLKGWIYISNESDEYGQAVDKIVQDPRFFN